MFSPQESDLLASPLSAVKVSTQRCFSINYLRHSYQELLRQKEQNVFSDRLKELFTNPASIKFGRTLTPFILAEVTALSFNGSKRSDEDHAELIVHLENSIGADTNHHVLLDLFLLQAACFNDLKEEFDLHLVDKLRSGFPRVTMNSSVIVSDYTGQSRSRYQELERVLLNEPDCVLLFNRLIDSLNQFQYEDTWIRASFDLDDGGFGDHHEYTSLMFEDIDAYNDRIAEHPEYHNYELIRYISSTLLRPFVHGEDLSASQITNILDPDSENSMWYGMRYSHFYLSMNNEKRQEDFKQMFCFVLSETKLLLSALEDQGVSGLDEVWKKVAETFQNPRHALKKFAKE